MVKSHSAPRPDVQVPTIPSKLETVLFKGEREKKGFASQSLRFADAGESGEGAAPGSYSLPSNLSSPSPSWGKRGTGGFASITKRFVVGRAGGMKPGPGTYTLQSSYASIRKCIRYSRTLCNSNYFRKT